MPSLPSQPSSDEDEDTDRTPTTPLRNANIDNLANAKTPRPPGAWATPSGTQAPARFLPTEDEDYMPPGHTLPYTPPASLSRATSLPLKTPAPPGAYAATPGSLRRKTPMKVHFDDQSPYIEEGMVSILL